VFVLTQDTSSDEARLMSSIIFKNTILNRTNEESLKDCWFKIDELTRNNIKEGLMALLGSG
jgi:hypothetical protein